MQTVTYEEDHLVKRHRGTMPVILTCPHDGDQSPPGVQKRKKETTPDECQFTIKSDLQTAFITQSMAERILGLTGLSPYVVMASFDRKFIDANRARSPVNCAFTDPAARPFYDEYHNRIFGFVNEIRGQNDNRGFLFDIHGKVEIPEDPADIYLGTDKGVEVCCPALIEPASSRNTGCKGCSNRFAVKRGQRRSFSTVSRLRMRRRQRTVQWTGASPFDATEYSSTPSKLRSPIRSVTLNRRVCS
jgi:hypothetical protein